MQFRASLRPASGILSLAVLAVASLTACAPRLSVPATQRLLDGLFAPPTAAERELIAQEWEEAEVHPEGVRVEWERRERNGTRTLVLSHVVEGARHYGAVRIPPDEAGQSLPVLVVAHGGDRGASGYHFFHTGPLAAEWIQVVPSFRSERLMLTPFRIYRSEGLSNPWDGDVDDSMALLGAVLTTIAEADSTRVAVFGHSRGGGVALLMGIRDPRIKAVVSIAAPTDFFLPDIRRVAERGLRWPLPRLPGASYLADSVLFALRDGRTSVGQARLELLRRSPAWFTDRLPPTQVHHGQNDDKVPYAHAVRLSRLAQMDESQGVVEFHSYPTGKHRTRTLQGAVQRAEQFLEQVSNPAPPAAAQPAPDG
jgi:dipeptidyl aminopeptidase/acylaminoacyl peptidase